MFLFWLFCADYPGTEVWAPKVVCPGASQCSLVFAN